jgi:hypothetical protein
MIDATATYTKMIPSRIRPVQVADATFRALRPGELAVGVVPGKGVL